MTRSLLDELMPRYDVRERHATHVRATPGRVSAGWNFSVEASGPDGSIVRTETRVQCSPGSTWKFRLYWALIRPGSGLIRRSMLAAIKRAAE